MAKYDTTLEQHLNLRMAAVHDAALSVSGCTQRIEDLADLPKKTEELREAVKALSHDFSYFFAATRAAVLPPPPVLTSKKAKA